MQAQAVDVLEDQDHTEILKKLVGSCYSLYKLQLAKSDQDNVSKVQEELGDEITDYRKQLSDNNLAVRVLGVFYEKYPELRRLLTQRLEISTF